MWKYDIVSNIWEYVDGSQSKDTVANYTLSYPGGLEGQVMVLDSTDRYIYLFGGEGVLGI